MKTPWALNAETFWWSKLEARGVEVPGAPRHAVGLRRGYESPRNTVDLDCASIRDFLRSATIDGRVLVNAVGASVRAHRGRMRRVSLAGTRIPGGRGRDRHDAQGWRTGPVSGKPGDGASDLGFCEYMTSRPILPPPGYLEAAGGRRRRGTLEERMRGTAAEVRASAKTERLPV